MQPDEDERILAALAHASIIANIANLIGMVAALLIWATQRERSPYVRGHALQALAYQALVVLVALVLVMVWGACILLALLPALVRPDLYAEGGPPALLWPALLVGLLPLAVGLLASGIALYGATRVYAGEPFRYPIVGRLAEPRPAPAASTPEATHEVASETLTPHP
jgi:uncharacterized Tic20 family protein